MAIHLPYCGVPPVPGEMLTRFNGDPILIAALLGLLALHLWALRRDSLGRRIAAIVGWLLAAVALLSPLCALSVALFSARVTQHMIIILAAAPLIAWSLPQTGAGRNKAEQPSAASHALPAWGSAAAFFVALWFWHMPKPYDATFDSTAAYWAMHLSLFTSAVWLWHELLRHAVRHASRAILIGAFSSMQMGFLGALITLASRPLYFWHLATTAPWGLTALQDQQLGGVIMWVPGIALFLMAAMRSLSLLLNSADAVRAA